MPASPVVLVLAGKSGVRAADRRRNTANFLNLCTHVHVVGCHPSAATPYRILSDYSRDLNLLLSPRASRLRQTLHREADARPRMLNERRRSSGTSSGSCQPQMELRCTSVTLDRQTWHEICRWPSSIERTTHRTQAICGTDGWHLISTNTWLKESKGVSMQIPHVSSAHSAHDPLSFMRSASPCAKHSEW